MGDNQCGCKTCFGGVSHFGTTNVIGRLETNLKMFLDSGFLCIGGWTNIENDMPGNLPVLRQANCAPGKEGLVWEGWRKDWVWHSGVEYVDLDGSGYELNFPPQVFGDNIPYISGYSVDYPNGQVVFDVAPAAEVISATYSFRNVQTLLADEAPWWKELQYLSWDIDENHFQRHDETGDWSIGSHHRVQMPCVIIYSVPRGGQEGYSLGNLCKKRVQDVVFDIYCEDKFLRDNIVDALTNQNDRDISLYNVDAAIYAGDQPLDENGYLKSGKDYKTLVEDYPWGCAKWTNTNVTALDKLRCGLHLGTVRSTFEVFYKTL